MESQAGRSGSKDEDRSSGRDVGAGRPTQEAGWELARDLISGTTAERFPREHFE